MRHAHIDDSATHACCSSCGDRHCTVTVASTTAGDLCNPCLTRVAPPHPPWMGAGQGDVMAARPLFTERGQCQTLAAVGPRHGLSETCAQRTPWGPGLMVLHVLLFQQERSVTPIARAAPASRTPTAPTGLVCPALPSIPTSLRRVEGAETLSQTHHTTVPPSYPNLPCIDCFLSFEWSVNDE